jgi:hypothetical protein
LGIITVGCDPSVFVFTVNSERRKLSVDAKVSLPSAALRYIHARTGLTAPSAVENNVFSIALLRSFDCIFKGLFGTRFGITGNFSALIHLNFVLLEAVVNFKLHHFSSSTFTSLS